MVEQARRLRRDTQSRPGRPRVTVRANYVGLPSMAGRGTDERGEIRGIKGCDGPSPTPEVRSRGPKTAAVERRRACALSVSFARTPGTHAACATSGQLTLAARGAEFTKGASCGAPLPRLVPGPRKDRHTRRLTKTRAADAWLFDMVSGQNITPHPEEARSAVSKDGQRVQVACMVRDALLRNAPHHEERSERGKFIPGRVRSA
jgi:hypothetical protein